MSTASPPTHRVVRVLETVGNADAGGADAGGLAAAEVARRTGIAVATCHAVIAGLHEAGYLWRDAGTRRYRLGPAAVALGDAARRGFPAVVAIHPELQALAETTGFACTAAAVIDGDIVVLDEVGGDGLTRTGQRVPLAPPFGALHVAWADDRTVDEWLERAPVPLDREQRGEYLAVLADVRDLSYAVSPLDPAALRLREALAELTPESMSADLRARTSELLAALPLHDYRLAALRGRAPLRVNTISAPVRDETGQLVLVLSLHVLDTLAPAEIRRLGALLLRTAERTALRSGV